MADSTVVTSGAAFVRSGKNCGAADGHNSIVIAHGQGSAEIQLSTCHFHWRKKLAVGKLRQAFRLTADSGKLLYVVIPGSNILVANRPVHRKPFAQIGFEIKITPSVALPPPGDGLSANLAPADPGERLTGFTRIGILDIVYKKLMGKFITSVITLALDKLRALTVGAIVPTTIFQFPNGKMLDVISFRNNRSSRL